MSGAGASSMIFWCRRCIEQSRSNRKTAFLCSSASTWISMCRGFSRYFSMYTIGLPKAALASALVRLTAGSSAASVWTTRIPRPPPPPAALIITGYLMSRARRITSVVSSGRAASEPGTQRIPALVIATFAFTLSPISRIVSGRGPMKTNPLFSTFSAKSAFSDRNP